MQTIDRPDKKQLTLYVLNAIVASLASCGVAFPLVILGMLPVLIRYHTMRYRFDDEGIGVSWGWLFRHESYLTYEKIQDIHLHRGFFERWLELGTVSVQTAAGSADAEVTFIGLTEFDAVRDYLYARMRQGGVGKGAAADGGDDVIALLRAIKDEVHALGERLAPPRADDA